MRIPLLAVGLSLAVCSVVSGPSLAASKPPAKAASDAPKSIGKFDDWQAAVHAEAGAAVCYAFTRAASSVPAVPGRGPVVLTVTERPAARDAVAISAGYVYPANAEVNLQVEQTGLAFYTAGRAAFARDGHAAVLAFQKGRQAVARAPGPRNGTQIADTFSLRGFSAAYAAVVKTCPPP